MCGIVGFITQNNIAEELLGKMVDSIQYRGPDDRGTYMHRMGAHLLGLGHRRLSILDLSPSGHQPMISEDNQIAVVFNGEIYNYLEIKKELQQCGMHFQTTCDTEIILQAYRKWGIDCVKRFNGMFAFSLFDKTAQTLYLVRDRIGIKPLYYYFKNGELFFASELKPLIICPYVPKEIHYPAINTFLCHGYIAAPYTIFKNTFKLEPGTIAAFKKGELKIRTYWSIKNAYEVGIGQQCSNEEEYLEQLEELLVSSIKYRQISDVPLGAFLSGGIDSSLVVALMRKHASSTVKTFSIGFHEKKYDEAPFARSIAQHLETEHEEFYFSQNDSLALVDSMPKYYDEPFADSSLLPTMLLCNRAKHRVTVCLSGDGGDELFCGYNRYATIARIHSHPLAPFLSAASHFPYVRHLLNQIHRRLVYLTYCGNADDAANFSYLYSQFARNNICLKAPFRIENRYYELLDLSDNIYEKCMLQDLNTYLVDDILAKVDRASMAVALEARVPLLDHRMIEFSLRLPLQYKRNGFTTKYLLRKLLYRHVPASLFQRPKKGFSVPVQSWLHTSLLPLVNNYLSDEYVRFQSIFNPVAVAKIKRQFGKKQWYYEEIIWKLLVFQIWWHNYKKYIV